MTRRSQSPRDARIGPDPRPPQGGALILGSYGVVARFAHSDSIASARCSSVDVVITALDAQAVRRHQHVDVAEPLRRLELVAGELDLQAVRVLQVDRVHEPAVALDEIDASVAQALPEPAEASLSRH